MTEFLHILDIVVTRVLQTATVTLFTFTLFGVETEVYCGDEIVISRRIAMASSRRTVTGLLLSATFVLALSSTANALPAFARKYGLRCSACHEAWPMLNYFGQKFKDNGYQLMNDRDAPIWQNPSYWPVTFRIIPYWHQIGRASCRERV